jgi:hypothetical protein
MNKFMAYTLSCAILLAWGTAGLCSTFDVRLWEKYAEIETSSVKSKGSLAGVYLEPQQLGDITSKPSFADLRVMTDQKEEVPSQVVSRRPERRREEIPHQMYNLSHTGNGETWLELSVEKQATRVNALEVITPDTGFSRQVEVLGSSDGKTWNTLRKDGVIFDITRGEKLRYTRIQFPQAGFHYLALKIANGGAQPLIISDVKVLQESDSQGQTYTVRGTTDKQELNASRRESSIIVHMNTVFPLDRLIIATAERNFQRSVDVQIKRGTGDWEQWAQGTIFSFDTPAIHESQLAIDMPEVAAKEFRLVLKNLDSPPLSVTSINGEGYSKLLVFKEQSDHKLYLFWGNPLAQQPLYDLAGLIARQKMVELPIASLGQARLNTGFAGNNARLPFTERYKYLLYVVVTMAIAGLILLQYRVFRRVDQ